MRTSVASSCGVRLLAAAVHSAIPARLLAPAAAIASRRIRQHAALRMPLSESASAAFSTAAASSPFAPAAPAAAASSSSSSSSPSRAPSFIELAKREGAAALLGPFHTAGLFDSCLRGLTITRMDPAGIAEGWMDVTSVVENSWGKLHGGATATLVDVMGSLALLAKDHKRGGVSVEINVSYLRAVSEGERVICKAHVTKLGRALGFTQVDLYTQSGELAATGRHTKAM